jgi:hypothetical protein
MQKPWRGSGRGEIEGGIWVNERGGPGGRGVTLGRGQGSQQRADFGAMNKKIKPNESESHQSNQIKTFKCLYSHQKLKKKKSWLDGELKVCIQQKKCLLYKIEENQSNSREILDSKYCPDLEIDRIVNGIADSIEFEKYLVEVDHVTICGTTTSSSTTMATTTNSTHSSSSQHPMNSVQHLTSKLKKAPFKVPQTVVPIPSSTEEHHSTSKQPQPNGDLLSRKRGYYSVDEEELDDIWDSTHREGFEQQEQAVETLQPDPFLRQASTNGSNLSSLDFNITSTLSSTLNHHPPPPPQITQRNSQLRHEEEEDDDDDNSSHFPGAVSGVKAWEVGTDSNLDVSHTMIESRERYSFYQIENDDSNPWTRYGEGLEDPDEEGEEVANIPDSDCQWPNVDERNEQNPNSTAENPSTIPTALHFNLSTVLEEKIESNIWSRLGDSSHLGFDESSN